jgi:acyl transferase domain-containing protein/NAD(P)H-dependent flavin oxidoreductase YrpB (nitropropane dioxygenase family)
MRSPVFVVTPAHRCDPRLAIAAARAGACGVLDLGPWAGEDRQRSALEELAKSAGRGNLWGVRCDIVGSSVRLAERLQSLTQQTCPLLIVGGIDFQQQDAGEILAVARSVARRVLAEAYSLQDAVAAEEAGFYGVVLVGWEAGGRTSVQSAYVLLQQACGRLRVPYWIRGGIGPQTAAAALLAGAAGVVLGEQLWLARPSPLTDAERHHFSQPDGGDATTCLCDGRVNHRVSAHAGRTVVKQLEQQIAAGRSCAEVLAERFSKMQSSDSETLVPLGQEIALAAPLAALYGTVGRILANFRASVEQTLCLAKEHRALVPENGLARELGVKYPILQGPMCWVSDTADFGQQVADNGALPLLALGWLPRPAAEQLLADTATRLGDRPWGVGLWGYLPEELRKEQLLALQRTRPKYALLIGGSAEQAKGLEEFGISTFLCAESRPQLDRMIGAGLRKFVLAGCESGGRVGTTTSFSLWQTAIDGLLEKAAEVLEDLQIVFAGGIHDAVSSAMVGVIAAPLAARGVKVGVMMGTAYLLTPEAVHSGAITAEFQRQAIACQRTTLLSGGSGGALRCAPTPAVDDFFARQRQLASVGRTADETRYELEMFQVGRQRLAAKGVLPASATPWWQAKSGAEPSAAAPSADGLAALPEEQQRLLGLFVLGEAAGLRSEVQSMAELHAAVCQEPVPLWDRAVEFMPTWWRKRPRKRLAEPLAVVGVGCMFPQSPDVQQYWQNIIRRFDAVREVPPDRWRPEDFFHPERSQSDHFYSKLGAFLEPVAFDPFRYRIPPASLPSIEPIQLLALEVARQALEDAGYQRPEFPRQRTAVIFAVAGMHDVGLAYSFRTALRHWLPQVAELDETTRRRILADLEGKLPKWTEDSFPGFLPNVVPGRIANRFNLTGANFTVDAACASSLAALQVGAEQLRSGACDAALVGAADGSNNFFCYMSFAKTHAMSPGGRSRPFDETADGIGLGEGVGAVVLKRLRDAERDGDKIYAVIRGIGSSSDGMARSLTAPFPDGQSLAIRRAYEDAGVSPATVTLVESHGTGTAVGDRVEVQALTQLFASEGASPRSCAIGSIKSMIGHTKTTAGLASLLKVILAIRHGVLPPTIGVKHPNATLRQHDCPFYLCSEPRPWLSGGGVPRRAGVSAFGFGGTNFHVVLEEYTQDGTGTGVDMMPRAGELFAVSRSGREELLSVLADLQRQVSALTDLQKAAAASTTAGQPLAQPGAGLELAQLARAVALDERRRKQSGEKPTCRLAIVAESLGDLHEKLRLALSEIPGQQQIDNPAGIYYSEASPLAEEQVCFLFPGQGSQAVNMLQDLWLLCPWAWELLEKADRHLAAFFERPLSRLVYPLPVFADDQRQQQQQRLNDTRVTQPALGLVEAFACQLLGRFGVRPGMVAGHSYGELVALYAAGVYTFEDLLKFSATRGQAVYEVGNTAPGGMAAVMADAGTTAAALAELKLDARIANYNSDTQTVIAGPIPVIDDAVQKLPEKGLRARKLPVSAAFHTPAVEPARQRLDRQLSEIILGAPRLPVYSNSTALPYPTEAAEIRRLQSQHLTSPVQFIQLLEEVYQAGARVFVEVGPGGVLTGLVRRNLKDRPYTALQLDGGQRDGWLQFGHLLARLFSLGLPVQWEPWFENRPLGAQSVAALFDDLRARYQRKATDWIVSPRGVQPWSAASNGRAKKTLSDNPRGRPTSPDKPRGHVGRDPTGEQSPQPPAAERFPPLPSAGTALPEVAREQKRAHEGALIPRRFRAERGEQGTSSQTILSHQPTPVAMHSTTEPIAMHQQATTMKTTPAASSAHNGKASGAADLMAQFQSTIARWLEMQQQQAQISQQFLEMERAVMLACLQGTGAVPPLVAALPLPPAIAAPAAPPAAAPDLPAAVAAPAVAVPATPTIAAPPRKMRVPPAPVLPPMPSGAADTDQPVARPKVAAAAPVVSTAPARSSPAPAPPPVEETAAPASPSPPALLTPSAPAASEEMPSLEVFRQDLLEAVSDRTGYPIDMLDETLELEAGLGIDSIKIIEIFDMLSKYHAYLLGANETQEETLAAFAKLRTLRDILDTYQNNVHQRRQQPAAGGNGRSAPQAVVPVAAAARVTVERATLQAVEAPLGSEAQKKNRFPGTTSY